MDKTPNKWKKHLTLVEFGFKTQSELEHEVHRYSRSEIDALIEDISSNITSSKDNLYTISFIPISSYFKLPNASIHTQEDLENFKTNIAPNLLENCSEVWYFKKPYRENLTSSIGRFCINNDHTIPSIKYAQVIEQVWNCSHREIEHFHKNSKALYLRASREGWGRHYTIDQIRAPSKEQQKQLVKQFYESVVFLERQQEKIEYFSNYLSNLGIHELSLEYMYSEKGFQVIDWDTENDLEVLDNLFPEEKGVER